MPVELHHLPGHYHAYDAEGVPLLSIQCLDGRPEFFINRNFEVPASLVAVTYRLDEGAAVDATWKSEGITISTEDKIRFVKSLVRKRKLSLTITFPGARRRPVRLSKSPGSMLHCRDWRRAVLGETM
jgi:hypothetical protein